MFNILKGRWRIKTALEREVSRMIKKNWKKKLIQVEKAIEKYGKLGIANLKQ